MPRGRVTIVDVARHAGVAKSTVSYALNDLPGVSDQTRRRVREAAEELGWRPSAVARALSKDRVGTVGLILARDPRSMSVEPFFNRLTTGLESELSRNGTALMIQFVADVAAEVEAYRTWWAERRVDGVVMLDCRVNDPRLDLPDEVPVPAIMLGAPPRPTRLHTLSMSDGDAMRCVVEHLHGLGHERIGWCRGPSRFAHTVERERAFHSRSAELGVAATVGRGDYTSGSVPRALGELLDVGPRPTALIFDNDVMAAAGLGLLTGRGLTVPTDMSVVSWEDSMLCTATFPQLTSLHRDTFGLGVTAARVLLELIEGRPVAPPDLGSHRLVVRASTARI